MERAELSVMRSALGCSDCFGDVYDLGLERAGARMPQVRWVGESYREAQPRVAVILINPGAAKGFDEAMRREAALFREFEAGGSYAAVQDYFRAKIRLGEKWICWYRDAFGLNLEEIAHLNIAWCATQGDKYPPKMLAHCFEKHTSRLLKALDPEVVILSGGNTHRFAPAIAAALPNARVIETIHYANRGSYESKQAEARRVRTLLTGDS